MAMNKMYEVSNRYHDYKDYTREYGICKDLKISTRSRCN